MVVFPSWEMQEWVLVPAKPEIPLLGGVGVGKPFRNCYKVRTHP